MNEPHNAKVVHPNPTTAGWWYENRNSIDICVEIDTGTITGKKVGQVRIRRQHLKDWLERTEPKR